MESQGSDEDSTSGSDNSGPPAQRSSVAAFPYGIPTNQDLNIPAIPPPPLNSPDAGRTSNPVGLSVARFAPSNNAVAPGTSGPSVLPDDARSSEHLYVGYPLSELVNNFFGEPQPVRFIRTDTPGSETFVFTMGRSWSLANGRRV